MDTAERADRIARFENWFTARLQTADRLHGEAGHSIDGLLVLAASFEAMAGYWQRTLRVSATSAADRFARFLFACARDARFDRVPVGFLHAQERGQRAQLAAAIAAAFPFVADESALVRTWDADPVSSDLCANLVLATVYAAVPPRAQETQKKTWQRYVHNNRYGAVLYRELRCCVVHELQLSPDVDVDRDRGRALTVPNYANHCSGSEHYKRLRFPWSFLVQVYRRALAGLVAECELQGLAPE